MNPERRSQTQRILWIIIFSVSLLLSIKQRDYFQLGIYKDDASYILLAKSIINSHQFGSLPGLNSSVIHDFPFGFPLLLAPLLIVFHDNYWALKIISLIATLLNVAIIYWGWRWLAPKTSTWWGLIIAGIYALFPLTIRHTSMVMSEPIFTTFCLLSIILTEYTVRQNKPQNAYYIFIGILLAISFYIRTIGIALILGVIFYLILKYSISACKPVVFLVLGMALITTSIIVLTPIQITNIIPKRYLQNDLVRITANKFGFKIDSEVGLEPAPVNVEENSPSDYSDSISPWLFIFGGFRWHLEEDVRDIILPMSGGQFERSLANLIGFSGLPKALGLFVSIITFFGMLLFSKQYGANLFLIFAATYFVVLTLWVWEGSRLLYPVQSQFQFAFLFGLQAIFIALLAKFWEKDVASKYANGLLITLVLLMMSISIYKGYTLKNSSYNAGDIQVRTQWLKENTAPDAVILSGEPATDYLYVQRNVIKLPTQANSGFDFARYLQESSVDYVLVAPEIQWQPVYQPLYGENMVAILPSINRLVSENRLSLVHEDSANLIRVYQVKTVVSQ